MILDDRLAQTHVQLVQTIATAPPVGSFEMLLVAIVDPIVLAYWFEALPAYGSKLVGIPSAATNSKPRSGFIQSKTD